MEAEAPAADNAEGVAPAAGGGPLVVHAAGGGEDGGGAENAPETRPPPGRGEDARTPATISDGAVQAVSPVKPRRTDAVGDAEWEEVKRVLDASELSHWREPLKKLGKTSARRFLATGGGGFRAPPTGLTFKETADTLAARAMAAGLEGPELAEACLEAKELARTFLRREDKSAAIREAAAGLEAMTGGEETTGAGGGAGAGAADRLSKADRDRATLAARYSFVVAQNRGHQVPVSIRPASGDILVADDAVACGRLPELTDLSLETGLGEAAGAATARHVKKKFEHRRGASREPRGNRAVARSLTEIPQ